MHIYKQALPQQLVPLRELRETNVTKPPVTILICGAARNGSMIFKLQSSILFYLFSTVLLKLKFRFFFCDIFIHTFYYTLSQLLDLMEKRISANGADKTVRAKAEKEELWEKQRGASRPVNQYSPFKQHKGLPVHREIFSLSDVSYFLSDAVVSTTAENKVGEEKCSFHLTFPSPSEREVRPATWRLGPKQRPQWNATYQLAPYVSLRFLFYFYTTQDHLPRTGTTTVAWVLLHQLLICKMPP